VIFSIIFFKSDMSVFLIYYHLLVISLLSIMNNFEELKGIVRLVLNSWPSYQFAIKNQLGGSETFAKVILIYSIISDYIKKIRRMNGFAALSQNNSSKSQIYMFWNYRNGVKKLSTRNSTRFAMMQHWSPRPNCFFR
jgi:hypothetical protein